MEKKTKPAPATERQQAKTAISNRLIVGGLRWVPCKQHQRFSAGSSDPCQADRWS